VKLYANQPGGGILSLISSIQLTIYHLPSTSCLFSMSRPPSIFLRAHAQERYKQQQQRAEEFFFFLLSWANEHVWPSLPTSSWSHAQMFRCSDNGMMAGRASMHPTGDLRAAMHNNFHSAHQERNQRPASPLCSSCCYGSICLYTITTTCSIQTLLN